MQKKALQSAALALSAGIVLAAAACSDIEPPTGAGVPSFNAAGGNPPAHAQNGLDREFARLAREIPGFGGYYYENGTPVVRLKDLGQRGRAQEVLARRFADDRVGGRGIRFVKGDFDFTELQAWADRLPRVLELSGVVFTDIDEARNRLTIGVVGDDARSRAVARIAELAIPGEAVIVEATEPIEFRASLQDYNRPLQGGLQIAYPGYLCTLGFNADRYDGVPAFVTNSHCSGTRGAVGTQYYQPYSWSYYDFIGTEIVDPPFFTMSQNSACPWFRQCRYSDAALVQYDAYAQSDFAGIARTTYRGLTTGSLNIDPANPRFSITSKRFTAPITGLRMEKVGRSTGWTSGNLSRTCVNVNVSNSSITLLCQNYVDAGSADGDSGSPVFYWWDPVQVTLFGILWGGSDSHYVFSWIGHVEQELGSLRVFQSAGGGGEEPPPPPPPGECEDPSQIICEA